MPEQYKRTVCLNSSRLYDLNAPPKVWPYTNKPAAQAADADPSPLKLHQ